ncbi:universal stress protein [Solicola sp. PLA-1-18]|uniref:universal stress protein n=1 Tax=Solicola sp. PLA-1-18 TaxID=3380532 RepID=UPI003B7C08AF
MTIVVGFGPDVQSTAGLNLAGQLAGSAGEPLVLCCVVHDSWESPTLARGVDSDWRNHLESLAAEAVARAREELPDDLDVAQVVRTGRSVPRVLLDEGTKRGASLLVVGSSTDGAFGHVALGSTSDRLVHSSDLPVALAPRGYRAGDTPVRRLVLALDPTRADVSLARTVAPLAERLGASVEAVTFAVRTQGRSAMGPRIDQGVYDAWRSQVEEAHRVATTAFRSANPSTVLQGTHLVEGDRWSTTLEGFAWEDGDLLVVGSSEHGPLARVFLGSTATRILRHTPVPVVVVPR